MVSLSGHGMLTLAEQSTNPKSAWVCSTLSETYRALGEDRYASVVVNSGRVQPRLAHFQTRAKTSHVTRSDQACAASAMVPVPDAQLT